MKKIIVSSKPNFDKFCEEHGYNDINIENVTDTVFISIISTENCQKYYLNEVEKHYFKTNHNNVLNMDFDDIDANMLYENHWFLAMSKKQGEELFNFIENNIDKNFVIHCRAGISRSGAVGTFIYNMYDGQFTLDTSLNNGYKLMPNVQVLTLLKDEYYKKYGYPFEEKIKEKEI